MKKKERNRLLVELAKENPTSASLTDRTSAQSFVQMGYWQTNTRGLFFKYYRRTDWQRSLSNRLPFYSFTNNTKYSQNYEIHDWKCKQIANLKLNTLPSYWELRPYFSSTLNHDRAQTFIERKKTIISVAVSRFSTVTAVSPGSHCISFETPAKLE